MRGLRSIGFDLRNHRRGAIKDYEVTNVVTKTGATFTRAKKRNAEMRAKR